MPSPRATVNIILSYAPGVGKTTHILKEAQRLKQSGLDVVIGFAETRDRPETMRHLEGLEIVPGRQVVHRGITVREMDLAALIKRRPALAIIDDAAHLNPPGFSNRVRYLDILDLAEQGIPVLTTLDLLHIESLADAIRQTTQITIRKKVPDAFLIQADQVILLDLAVDELLLRWKSGKLSPLDNHSNLLKSLFTTDNLTFLRHTAMQECAEILERKSRMTTRLQRFRAAQPDNPVAPRILVCSAPPLFPCSRGLIRFAWHLADSLNTPWFLVHIPQGPTGKEPPITPLITLAEELGAEIKILKPTTDPIHPLLDFARAHGVGHILAHHTRQQKTIYAKWRHPFTQVPLQQYINEGEEFHFHLLANTGTHS
ncbi:MAG: hypothetical protein H7832_09695 [Magnetococcus sp. DMHC-6]